MKSDKIILGVLGGVARSITVLFAPEKETKQEKSWIKAMIMLMNLKTRYFTWNNKQKSMKNLDGR
jgi:uncharacterized protein YifE (UPF0438 family)